MTLLAFNAGDAAYWGLARLPRRDRARLGVHAVPPGTGVRAALVAHLGHGARPPAGDREDRAAPSTGSTTSSTRLDTVTDSAVSMADSADTAVRAISTAIATPVEKVSGLAAGVSHGFSQFRKSKNFGDADVGGKGGGAQARSRPPRGPATCGSDDHGDRPPGRAATAAGRAEARSVAASRARAEAATGPGAAGRADRRLGTRTPGSVAGTPRQAAATIA